VISAPSVPLAFSLNSSARGRPRCRGLLRGVLHPLLLRHARAV